MSFVFAITDSVFRSSEPELRVLAPLGIPLRQAPNVILTPHLAFYSRESVEETRTAEEVVARALRDEPPRSPMNPEVLTR